MVNSIFNHLSINTYLGRSLLPRTNPQIFVFIRVSTDILISYIQLDGELLRFIQMSSFLDILS